MVTIAAAVGAWLIAIVTTVAASAPARQESAVAKPAPAAQAPAPTGGYVGAEKCLECHEDKGKSYDDSKHSRAQNPRTPAAAKECESCHGPGQAHVEKDGEGGMTSPKEMKPRAVSEVCTTCHNRTDHVAWDGGKHDSRNMSCVTCHSIHEAKSDHASLKTETQIETCVQCHRKEVNKVHRTSHMPVREGKLECSTCHNPHGSQNVKMLREGNSINEACASCHTEKRGPFLWEHAPGKESCVSCHDPHGSNNERMLVAKVPMLCQRCHIHSRHPATIYDQTQVNNRNNRVVGRACVNCHSQVHGSNHPTSGKFFVR
jgi:DmsE family decaheme c-type cytochrome